MAADVAGAVAAVDEGLHAHLVDFFRGAAGLHVFPHQGVELLLGVHHVAGDLVHAVGHQRAGILHPVAALAGNFQAVHHAVGVLQRALGREHHLRQQ